VSGFVLVDDGRGRRRGLFPHLAAPGLVHAVTTRDGPDLGDEPSHDPAHAVPVGALAAELGLDGIAWAFQVHGDAVLHAEVPGYAGPGDALWTDRPGLGVMARSADCPLVLVAGEQRDGSAILGVAHASWRSTVQRITARLVDALACAGADPSRLRAGIAPSAGPCCYEVGEEVRDRALEELGPGAAACFREREDSLHFDLWAANRAQLRAAGLPDNAIVTAGLCSLCRNDLFFSYRREGAAAGRYAAVIGTVRSERVAG
jgi:hypothetical protein